MHIYNEYEDKQFGVVIFHPISTNKAVAVNVANTGKNVARVVGEYVDKHPADYEVDVYYAESVMDIGHNEIFIGTTEW